MPVNVAFDEGMECVIVVDVTSPLRPASKVVAPWEIGEQIMGIMMQGPNEDARAQADVVITPALGDHLSSDFTNIERLIEEGEQAARALLSTIRSRLELPMQDSTAVLSYPSTFDRSNAEIAPQDERHISSFIRRSEIRAADVQGLVDDLYSTGRYADVTLSIQPDSTGGRMELSADRFPVLNMITMRGTTRIDPDTLASFFSDQVGKPIDARASRQSVEDMLLVYRGAGYSLAHIEDISFDAETGNATIEVDEGRISRMVIKGTTKTRDYVIWRELPFDRGDVFEVTKVARGLANIYSTNLFEQASVKIELEGERQEDLIVILNVRERNTELVRLGIRVDNERAFQPWLNVQDENFLGSGAELGVNFAGGSRNESVIAELKAYRIFDSYFTSRLRAYLISKDINTYSTVLGLPDDQFERTRSGEIREVRRGGSLSFGTQLERLGNVIVEGRLERVQVYNIFNQPIANQTYTISSIRFGTRVDTRNKMPFPTDGVNLEFDYETAFVKTGTSLGFTKLLFSYGSFETFGQDHTINPRIKFGLGDDAVPTSEQFSLGGQEAFFGYREDNARGRQLLVAGLEYRYRLPFKVFFDTYLSIRYDIGAVWLRPDEIRLVDLQHGIGIGVGFDTPIGPAQFALGRSFIIRDDLLNHPLSLGKPLAYFSIGYAFD
jgi:NTE family protein